MILLYSVNSYSYHLGSTTWYLLGTSIFVYALNVKRKRAKDILFALSIFISYPSIVFLFAKQF